jgi:hypothetical protein
MTEKFSKNSINQPLKSLCTYIYIKLGLINNLKAMSQNGAAFMCLKNKFPRTRYAKIKENVFVGPQ